MIAISCGYVFARETSLGGSVYNRVARVVDLIPIYVFVRKITVTSILRFRHVKDRWFYFFS